MPLCPRDRSGQDPSKACPCRGRSRVQHGPTHLRCQHPPRLRRLPSRRVLFLLLPLSRSCGRVLEVAFFRRRKLQRFGLPLVRPCRIGLVGVFLVSGSGSGSGSDVDFFACRRRCRRVGVDVAEVLRDPFDVAVGVVPDAVDRQRGFNTQRMGDARDLAGRALQLAGDLADRCD
ncbi:MAG: hypothetical protein F9B45_09755 [Phycisphaera sp. RhM]|nr:hypothetical protein [Phycisphaera sp. RhM]